MLSTKIIRKAAITLYYICLDLRHRCSWRMKLWMCLLLSTTDTNRRTNPIRNLKFPLGFDINSKSTFEKDTFSRNQQIFRGVVIKAFLLPSQIEILRTAKLGLGKVRQLPLSQFFFDKTREVYEYCWFLLLLLVLQCACLTPESVSSRKGQLSQKLSYGGLQLSAVL